MTQLKAFEIVHDDEHADCLELTTLRMPLADVIAARSCSFDGRVSQRRRRNHIHHPFQFEPEPDSMPLRTGTFVLRPDGGRRRIKGLVCLRDHESAPTWIPENLVPATGTALRGWLRAKGAEPAGEDWDAQSLQALGSLARELDRVSMPGGVSMVRGLPGLYGTGFEGCLDLDSLGVIKGRRMLARTTYDGVEFTVRRRIRCAAGQVPVAQRLRVWHDGSWSGSDGRTFVAGSNLDDVPPRLWATMNARGRAEKASQVPMRPTNDLEPLFILRCPSTRVINAAGGPAAAPPPCASRPALLFATTDPMPLLTADGQLRDIPIVGDPSDAAAILVRAAGRGVYVPSARPLDVRDLPSRAGEWLVGMRMGGARR